MSAIEVLKEIIKEEQKNYEEHKQNYDELPKKYGNNHLKRIGSLKEALLALEKQEKQLYVAYEQGQYDSLDYYGFFSTDEEAVKELTKAIGESFTSGNEYRFFKLDFSKKGIDTSLPVKEVLGVLK